MREVVAYPYRVSDLISRGAKDREVCRGKAGCVRDVPYCVSKCDRQALQVADRAVIRLRESHHGPGERGFNSTRARQIPRGPRMLAQSWPKQLWSRRA